MPKLERTSSIRFLFRAVPLAAFVVGAIASSCGGGDDAAQPLPCESAVKGKCGKQCSLDGDCATGTYCRSGKCTADCSASTKCPSGKTCDVSRGRCVTSINLDSGSGGSSNDAGGDGCIKQEVTYKKQTPTIVLLIDQSGSMTTDFGGAGSRWQVVHDALMNQQTGIVKNLEADVRFGLTLYSSQNGFQNGGTCPMLTTVGPALNNFSAIGTVYDPAQPIEDTPTGESVDAVVAELTPFPDPGPKVIVLATDGEPDTCTVPDPDGVGKPQAVAAAQAAFSAGISLYIISVGDQVSLAHLQDMANAGVGLPIGGTQNAPYYQALDQAALIAAFNTIINGARPCTITLDGTLDPSQADKGKVTLDGTPLGYNDPNGWKLNSPTEIELQGSACQTIKTGDHTLNFDFPCGAYTPPPTH